MGNLLIETTFEAKPVIEEDQSGKKNMFITGPFMVAETKNRNGRLYPKSIMEKELDRYTKEFVRENRALGELNHPDKPSINLERASHLVTMLEMQGNVIVGKAKVLDTPCGRIAKSLMEEGVKIGVSSRGVGSLRENNGVNVVQDDFLLAAIDIVSDPSAPGAFVNGIYEGKAWVWENGSWKEETLEKTKEFIEEAVTKEDREKRMFEAFRNLLKSI